jgi:hypothetical protein
MELLPIPDEREQIAPHITAYLFYNGQGNRGRQGRIHGVSSLLQGREPCL